MIGRDITVNERIERRHKSSRQTARWARETGLPGKVALPNIEIEQGAGSTSLGEPQLSVVCVGFEMHMLERV